MPIPDRLALYRVHPESKSGGGSLLKARDYVRFADEFLAGSGLPGAAEGRGSAYLAAGDYFYDAGELAEARRALLALAAPEADEARRRAARANAGPLGGAVIRLGIDATSVAPDGQGHRARAARDRSCARASSIASSSSSTRVTRRSCPRCARSA